MPLDTVGYIHWYSVWYCVYNDIIEVDNKLAYQVNVFDNLKRQVPMEELVKEYQVQSEEKQQSLLSRLLSMKL